MATQNFQDFYGTTLKEAVTDSDLSCKVTTPPIAVPMALTLAHNDPLKREVVWVTAMSGDTLTIGERGVGSTTAKEHLPGTTVSCNPVAVMYEKILALIEDTTNGHKHDGTDSARLDERGFKLRNAQYAVGRNAADDGDVELYRVDTTDRFQTRNQTRIGATGGVLQVSGRGVGETLGGAIELELASDHNGDFDSWRLFVDTKALYIGNSVGTKLTLLDDGNLGVGVSTPSERLHLDGSLVVPQDAAFKVRRGSSNNSVLWQAANDVVYLQNPNNATLAIRTNGANDRLTISSSGAVRVFGTLQVDGAIVSDVTPSGTRALGTSGSRWNNVFSTSLNTSGTATIGTAAITTATITTLNSNMNPNANNSRSLGTTSLRWANVNTVNVNASGTSTISDLVVTTVSSNLIPDNAGSRDVGSSSKQWNRVFVRNYVRVGEGISSGAEGGQIDLYGAGSYANWAIDSYQNNLRVFSTGGNVHMEVQSGWHTYSANSIYPRNNPSHGRARLGYSGDQRWAEVWSLNGVIQTCDMRTKEGVRDMESVREKMGQLSVVRYRDKTEPAKPERVGLTAQEVQVFAPELVVEADDGTLGVNYLGMIPYLVKEVQELEAKISLLEAR